MEKDKTPQELPGWGHEEMAAHCTETLLREDIGGCWLSVSATDAGVFAWKLSRPDLQLMGLGYDLEDAYAFALKVYAEYMQEVA